jgi:hypothetical protein
MEASLSSRKRCFPRLKKSNKLESRNPSTSNSISNRTLPSIGGNIKIIRVYHMSNPQSITSEAQRYRNNHLELLFAEEGGVFLGRKSEGRYTSCTIFP